MRAAKPLSTATCALLVGATLALGSPPAIAAAPPVLAEAPAEIAPRKPISEIASKPLAGCVSIKPNIGGILNMSTTLNGSELFLEWQVPKVRKGWQVDGYNIYAPSPDGVMQLRGITGDLSYSLDFEPFLDRSDGPVPIQVAAYGSKIKNPGEAEEGCRAGQAINGKLSVTNGQRITKTTWKELSCLHLKDKVIIAVSGWFKGNGRVARPLSFGAAILLYAPARKVAGPLQGWLFRDFIASVKDWTTEVVDPVEDLRITAITCFSDS